MTRNKRISILLSVFVTISALAACNDTPATPSPTITGGISDATVTASLTATGKQTPTVEVAVLPMVATPMQQVSPSEGASSQPTVQPSQTTSVSTEQPVASETNPAGDIPDTQAFVKYSSTAGGYDLEVPEGWARTETGSIVVAFVDKLDGLKVAVSDAPSAPTVGSMQTDFGQLFADAGARAVKLGTVKEVQLPGGKAVMVEYTANSAPNPVTGKQVRLENNAFLFYKKDGAGHGKLATLTLWAPLGADNVDQWQRMSQSFRWH